MFGDFLFWAQTMLLGRARAEYTFSGLQVKSTARADKPETRREMIDSAVKNPFLVEKLGRVNSILTTSFIIFQTRN